MYVYIVISPCHFQVMSIRQNIEGKGAFTSFLTQCGNYKAIMGIMRLKGRIQNDYMGQGDTRYV